MLNGTHAMMTYLRTIMNIQRAADDTFIVIYIRTVTT
jgi:hypothetical protein